MSKVRRNEMSLSLDEPRNNLLLLWAADPHKRLAVDVVVLDATSGQALETLNMAGAYCVGYQEHFVAGNTEHGAYVVDLVLADPDGWTLLVGGPGVYVTAAARNHGQPPVPTTEATQLAAALGTKKQRYATRLKLLADSKTRFAREVQQMQQQMPHRLETALPDAVSAPLGGPAAEALRKAAGSAMPPLPPALTSAAQAIDRLDRNNMAVEMA